MSGLGSAGPNGTQSLTSLTPKANGPKRIDRWWPKKPHSNPPKSASHLGDEGIGAIHRSKAGSSSSPTPPAVVRSAAIKMANQSLTIHSLGTKLPEEKLKAQM